MGLNRYKLGDLIQAEDVRNTDGRYTLNDVKGISIQKAFIETKADMEGVSLYPYIIVKPDFFAYVTVTSRNGEKITLAHNDSTDTFIVSSSYVVFSIFRKDLLSSEYLFMYFNRPEFDRYSRFNSWGSARETFSWEDMCNIDIDLPDLPTQNKYADIYKAMVANQQSYERGLEDLKLTIDAQLDKVKHSFPQRPIRNLLQEIDVRNDNGETSSVLGINITKQFMPSIADTTGVNLRNYKVVRAGQFAYSGMQTGRDECIRIALYRGNEPIIISPAYSVFEASDKSVLAEYIMTWFSRAESDRRGWFMSDSSIRTNLDLDRFYEIMIPVPDMALQRAIVELQSAYVLRRNINERLKSQIKDICPILIRGSLQGLKRGVKSMTNQDLNDYIRHYIEHDKTRSAIMLTAPWGAGKSYYIETDLVPFLKREENGSHECVVVSLYGLSSLFELSKALYMESRMRFLSKGAEKVTTSIFAAKTILKGAASFFGIDLSKSQEEMKQLYDSIDLSGKLIILEDLERSGIDILEILGYVNSLTEQDGVKVLLVANEYELIHYERENAKTKEQQDIDDTVDRITDNKFRNHTEKTKTYLSTKEKTVSDTILYKGDVASAVLQIMSEYNKTYFGCFTTEAGKKEVTKYLQACDITNLRTFKFACQKANDIFERIKPNPETEYDYIKTIFFSIITFSQKIKSGKKEKWDGGRVFSTGLSSEKYPLFRFCYDYIMWQSFDESRVAGTKEELEKLRLYDKDKSLDDKDLHVLFSWWTCSEKDVNEAIKSITEKLKKEDSIAFYSYGKIAVEIIRAKAVIGCDIEETKELMVKNLYNKGSEIDADYLFLATMIDEKNPAVFAEYTQLKDALTASLAAKETTIFGFDYKEESIENLCLSVYQNDGRIYRDGEFATRLDMNKFVEMLKGCTAQNISRMRDMFLFLYRSENIKDFLEGDRETLETLLKYTQALESFEGYDKIQKMQMRFFSNNLKDIIDKL